MSKKTKNFLKWIPSAFAAFIIVMSATLKLIDTQQLIEHYTQLNLIQYIRIFGVMELLFTALFFCPRAFKIGLLLLTAYFGGAIATEISHGNAFIFPMVILALVWIATYCRAPEIFVAKSKQNDGIPYHI